MPKRGFETKKHFLFCLSYVGKKKQNNGKGQFQKSTEKSVFGVVVKRQVFC